MTIINPCLILRMESRSSRRTIEISYSLSFFEAGLIFLTLNQEAVDRGTGIEYETLMIQLRLLRYVAKLVYSLLVVVPDLRARHIMSFRVLSAR